MQLLNKGPLPPDEHGKTLRFQGCPLRASDHYALLLRLRLKDTG